MRKLAIGVGILTAVLLLGVAVDEFGYRRWRKSFETLAIETARSPSGWDGLPRSRSFDRADYSVPLKLSASRFVTSSKKPLAALVFEPPRYVWSYWLASRSAASYSAYERFFGSSFATKLALHPRDPCQLLFSPKGMEASCGFNVIVKRDG